MFFEEDDNNFFIEIAHSQQFKMGEVVGGDAFISTMIKDENRFVAVLSDGLGSGIRANVLSSLTASMAVNYRLQHRPLSDSMRSILDTLPVDPRKRIGYATCSAAEIDLNGEAHLFEFDNPDFIIFRGNTCIEPRKKSIRLTTSQGDRVLLESKIMLFKGDRIIMLSDGVTQSGLGSRSMPMGWERSMVINFIKNYLERHPDVSARELSKVVMQKALHNDLFEAKDDITCGVIYLRAPRRLLICTGPPFDPGNDKEMARIFDTYPGRRIVCGGTTAHILARELDRKVIGDGRQQVKTNLPTSARMEGAELVTEGILTLGHLADLIQSYKEGYKPDNSPAGEILKIIMDSDVIDFLMGTRINEAHYDPSLPVEMEIRRNLIRRLKVVLERVFMNKVRIKYI